MNINDILKSFKKLDIKELLDNKDVYYSHGYAILSIIKEIESNDLRMEYLIRFINIFEYCNLKLREKCNDKSHRIHREISELSSLINSILGSIDNLNYINAFIIMSPRYVNKNDLISDVCNSFSDEDKEQIIETALKLTCYLNEKTLIILTKISGMIKSTTIRERIYRL